MQTNSGVSKTKQSLHRTYIHCGIDPADTKQPQQYVFHVFTTLEVLICIFHLYLSRVDISSKIEFSSDM